MTRLTVTVAAVVATVAMSVSEAAQTSAYEAEAREILARIVGFRTSAGHGQTPAMVAYLTQVLTLKGVPASDIATLGEGEAKAMIARSRPGREPRWTSAHSNPS